MRGICVRASIALRACCANVPNAPVCRTSAERPGVPHSPGPGPQSRTTHSAMKDSLQPGITYQHKLLLGRDKMVPALYPEAEEFQVMPEVFATGFMVGFLEWACLKAVLPHIDWPREQTVGTHVNFSHEAATPAGLWVSARAELVGVNGRRLTFTVEADDGADLIARGSHERFVIDREKFDRSVAAKLPAAH